MANWYSVYIHEVQAPPPTLGGYGLPNIKEGVAHHVTEVCWIGNLSNDDGQKKNNISVGKKVDFVPLGCLASKDPQQEPFQGIEMKKKYDKR